MYFLLFYHFEKLHSRPLNNKKKSVCTLIYVYDFPITESSISDSVITV